MKKSIVVLVLAGVLAGGVFGQEQEKNQEQEQKNEGLWSKIINSPGFAPGVEGATVFINAGIGFEIPFLGYVGHNMPPLSVSVDYVPPKMPMSVGVKMAFSTLKSTYTGFSGKIEDCTNVDMALRLALHSKLLEQVTNLDIAALVLVGYDFATGDTMKTLKDNGVGSNMTGFYIGIGLGGRYFFTKNIGAFLEADVKVLQKMSIGASAGLALKF